ncbi:MAG: tRNA (N(6)-L-threonylcarbamoyladenosine(37)-C(2))-methylthiotransferase MtaB [Tenericutes bacterium]|nr:tRNA (N(6)-L-threonylcarbamoyladenosine(37)-C(2))-methylthiotransferase MtaB [Mycoplasmatota bacterium]MDD7629703.1 tRNA (N(6)-L-threonylcarbamoyladenosine(37)-C(2))-methylthiotransferase MtaB [bacterium]MDY4108507.1 tRNA (N(6)-L-threonylcarbamoyladenosine(37)-C(2))-methylthiotransferase MtaB [Bacilli bacterium]
MKVAIYTLGCKVNLYESEVIMNSFKKSGYEIVDFEDNADIVIINTCTVTNTSDKKSRNIIRQAVKKHENAVIVVMGCYSQVRSADIKEIDGVDIIIGNTKKSKVVSLVEEYLKNKKSITEIDDIMHTDFEPMELDTFETRTRAFVKIQDGCNNFCSYCIIPYSRGNIRSKEKDDVVSEIKCLVKNGYKEVVLTGIHTGHYGKDKYDYDFSDLLSELCKIDNLKRIRISSIEITELDSKFIDVLKNNKVIVNHMHIPLQSGCDKTLKEMNRKYDTKYYLDKINLIRSIRPNISITTDLIVGFPNETEEDFNNTLSFLRKVKFSKIHVFPYSRRKGTKADLMDNQIDEQTKHKRVKEVLKLSEELEIEYMNKFINTDVLVLIEKFENGIISGHTENYIPVKANGVESDINELLMIHIDKMEYPYLIGNKL